MKKEEKEKVQEILAYEDPQIKADVEIKLEQNHVKNKRIMKKALQDFYVKKHKDEFPIDEQKRKKERKEFTKTFKEAVVEDKEKKAKKRIEESRFNEKRKEASNEDKEQEIKIDSKKEQEYDKTFIEKVKTVAKEIWEGEEER